jgi:hypothetical protein
MLRASPAAIVMKRFAYYCRTSIVAELFRFHVDGATAGAKGEM